MKIKTAVTSILFLLSFLVMAATPPALINYQGVLRDGTGAPLNGSFDMTFRFYDLDTGGSLLLTDTHAGTGAAAVANGLFTVQLGGGAITPGSEPDLAEMFRDNAAVWLEIQIAPDLAPMSPRVRVLSSAYAQNAKTLDGNEAAAFATAGHTQSAATGGTGTNTSGAASGSLLAASGSGAWDALAPGASGQVLQSTGTGTDWVDQSAISDGDWTISDGSMYSSAGKSVGIGTTTPQAALQIQGSFLVNDVLDAQIDQEQPTCGFYGGGLLIWQAFTAGRTGDLTTVAFRTRSPLASGAIVSGTISVYAGEGISGTLLHSQAVTIGGDWSWRSFYLPYGVPVVSGNLYTMALQVSQSDRSWACFNQGNPYPGGTCYPWTNDDYQFQTYVGTIWGPALSVGSDAKVGIGTSSPGKALQIGEVSRPNTEGMVRLSSRSGTGGAQRTWDIGVPETEDEVTGKGYSFVIDDTQSGTDPEFMVKYGTGSVGIGTMTPNMPLTVKSNSVGDLLSLKDNLDANQWHLKYTGGLNFVESGVAEYRLYLQDGGRVGIGTSTPGFPLTFPNTLGDKISLWGQSGNHFGFGIQSYLLQVHTSDSSADIAFGHGSSAAMTETMRIKGNGNVGIGTLAPANKLDVEGGAAVGAEYSGTSAAPANGLIVEGAVGIGTAVPQAALHVAGPFLVSGLTDASLDQEQASCGWTVTPTTIWQSFTAGRTGSLNSIATNCMTPLSSGADSTGTLKIYAGEGTSGTLMASGTITIKRTYYNWQEFDVPGKVAVTSGSQYTWAIEVPLAQTPWPCYGADLYSGGRAWIASDCDLSFRTYVGTAYGPALSVSPDSSVGIGMTDPSYKLQLATDSAAKPSTNTWTIASDKRLKKDIAPFTDGLEVLERIDPVRYRYNGLAQLPTGDENIGVVAQEIQPVAPYTVRSYKAKLNPRDDQDTEFLGFNSHALTFVLINAVKELDERTKGLAGQDGKERITRKLSAGPKPLDGKERFQPGEPVPDTPAQPAVPTGAAIQMLPAIEGVEPGDVLVLNPANGDELYKCNLAADPMVVGVAALISGATAGGQAPVVTSGVTLVKADALHGSITKGDLLVASPTPGHAMKMGAFVPGTVIGKALEDLTAGTGMIRVLVMLR